MRATKSKGCFLPVAIFFCGVLGILILSQFGGQILNYLRSTNWQQSSGTIVSSTVESVFETSGERFVGNVVYVYDFENMTYEGDQVNFFGTIYVGNQGDAQQMIAPYPVGSTVTLYVDPNDPTQSVLDRDVSGIIWALVGFGIILTLLSIGLAIRHLYRS
ncbi:MAG: hypothetical protein Phog2KO_45310 [Phototrophicaceae bacterium]